ncbi:1,2-phenylacetyl-CoA epoxidase subunit PaaC [Nocardioides sp. zg-1228]|uniref:1,2-phenylacetyl-CoA epoxidase subunit PaaC n=1 Tax=Nocardioides sp. zg-1228 TaxID=2763008 RepID=UPI001643672D|nr:1,2-phenylacetyl-CoA epoxidase subunit PaaC [Nocardioides sp. zg-1228]MBC2934000.1 phenylacetate-CoA oxygenase subunit PaaC [Nocardioides sp. zg-1228]QSF58757.1 phenylacetate-CoA oxygenase subunit PaaC [Nocardioides sp. zg-1228]
MDSHIATPDEDEHDSAYSGLLVNDAHWAFGAAPVPDGHGEDPLAGVDTSVPEGVDAAELAAYALMLGDDALVMSHRVSEWTSNAPDLEDDIALSNLALDLLGQARLLLARAAKADASLVPTLPEGSPAPPDDALAFFRDAHQFRNVRLVELVNGDFAEATVRVLLFSVWRLATFERLRESRDHVLAAVAAKGVKELAYHRDYAARWFVTLAGGTDESRRRLVAALDALWPLWPELFDTHPVEAAAAAGGVGVDPATVRDDAEAVLGQVLAAADVPRPEVARRAGVLGRTGRDGMHGEPLSRMLAEMQSVARAHPRGLW